MWHNLNWSYKVTFRLLLYSRQKMNYRGEYPIRKIAEEYGFIVSPHKLKWITFVGKYPVRTKIQVNGRILEQVSSSNCFGCEGLLTIDNDTENKLNKFKHICSTIHRILQYRTRKETKLTFYKTMAVSVALHESERWVLSKTHRTKTTSSKMKFLSKKTE